MNPLLPLFAAVDAELIKMVVIVLIFIGAAVAQLLAKIRQFQPPAGRPLAPRSAEPDAGDEIEEFMRRAAERRSTKGAQPAVGEASPPAGGPVRAEVVAEQSVGGQVTEHVEQYLDEQKFTSRVEQLGEEVAQTDKQIDQHLRQVFDHRVSRLAAVPGEAAVPPVAYEPPDLVGAAADIPATFASGLGDLLSSPDSLRQAIILNEILHRPEERWG